MHELAITQSIVEIVCEEAEAARVRRVTLEIGRLSGVVPDAVRFCFDLVAQGSPAEGAELDIIEPAGCGRCRDCGRIRQMETLFDGCECGAVGLECIAGTELRIKQMELA